LAAGEVLVADDDGTAVSRSASAGATTLEFGGLRFDVSFREVGATLRVDGCIKDKWTEMLRFDDFVDTPHFHAPADGEAIIFDRASLGEPLEWYVAQIRDHLPEWLEKAGFDDVLPTIDLEAVSLNADRLTEAMTACVPTGFLRVPGIGLQRSEAPA
jgi:hypothetical protein